MSPSFRPQEPQLRHLVTLLVCRRTLSDPQDGQQLWRSLLLFFILHLAVCMFHAPPLAPVALLAFTDLFSAHTARCAEACYDFDELHYFTVFQSCGPTLVVSFTSVSTDMSPCSLPLLIYQMPPSSCFGGLRTSLRLRLRSTIWLSISDSC